VTLRPPTAPLPIGWAARRVRELVDPLAVRRAGGTVTVPPRRLRARTGAPGVSEFVDGGIAAAGELSATLSQIGRPLPEISSVLDLGCGSARVLPHVAALAPGAECAGCDVDAAAIDWARSHQPRIRWERSRFEPPLPFADGSFELVYSISVFSHLDERLGDDWLREVARVLAPGGIALLSVHGAHAFEQFRTGAVATGWCPRSAFERAGLRADEFVFEPYRRSVWNEGELPGVGAGYGLAFHGADYVRNRWPAVLGVLDVQPRAITAWQDLVVCQRRP
jgi:SAM-dependent methyltransferase